MIPPDAVVWMVKDGRSLESESDMSDEGRAGEELSGAAQRLSEPVNKALDSHGSLIDRQGHIAVCLMDCQSNKKKPPFQTFFCWSLHTDHVAAPSGRGKHNGSPYVLQQGTKHQTSHQQLRQSGQCRDQVVQWWSALQCGCTTPSLTPRCHAIHSCAHRCLVPPTGLAHPPSQ